MILDRKPLTDLLLTTLEGVGFPIGDASGPTKDLPNGKHAGWNGQPGTAGSTYVPYAVLTPAAVSVSSGPVSDPQADARLPFTLAMYGVNRGQVETLAGRLRVALHGLRRSRFNSAGIEHQIQQVWFDVLGGIVRVETTDPPTYGEIDTFTVWTTK